MQLTLAHADGSMHLHSQQFSTGELDGPMLLARLAEAVRPLEPVAAEFCRWVAERGAAHRRAGTDESFVSVVNLVGAQVLPHLATLVREVAQRWPEELELAALPDPRARPRATREPADGAPQFADVAVGFTAAGASWALRAALDRGPNDVISTVVFALWRARATDVIRTSASRSGDEIGGVHDHAVGIGARRSDDRLSDGALGRCAADAKADRLERRGDLVEARRLEAHVVCGDYAGLDAEISAGARDRETPA